MSSYIAGHCKEWPARTALPHVPGTADAIIHDRFRFMHHVAKAVEALAVRGSA